MAESEPNAIQIQSPNPLEITTPVIVHVPIDDEIKTPVPTSSQSPTQTPGEFPVIYAKYVDSRCYEVADNKKSPNKEFITFLISAIIARFRARYTSLNPEFSVKLEGSGQVQIIMLTRILCISAITKMFKNIVHGGIGSLREQFHITSIEHDAWTWFAGALDPQEKCSVFNTFPVSHELVDIAKKIVITESAAFSLPGYAERIADGESSDCAVECVLGVVANKLSQRIFDFFSPMVDLEQKTSIRITNTDISGILRLFNHDRIPARSEFFVELGMFGSKFEIIKKEIKAKLPGSKVGRKKKAT